MEPTDILRQITRTSTDVASQPALTVAVVYQDTRTWAWAAELWSRVAQWMGPDAAAIGAWSLDELSGPPVFREAVSAAANADAVIISIHAAEQSPPRLCAWIDAWLPRRHRPDGSLIALIGVSGREAAPSVRVQEYLRAVARKGGLEFLLHEYVGPCGIEKTPPRP